MRIAMTDAAFAALQAYTSGRPGGFKLVYDTEGCGCAVNGVPALWFVDGPEPGDHPLDSSDGRLNFWIDPLREIFFEDLVKLDYKPDGRKFKLYSDSQIYDGSLSVKDHSTGTQHN